MFDKLIDSVFNRLIALTYVYTESQKINCRTSPNVFYKEYLRTLKYITSNKK